jgi:hypothetical protein
MVNASAFKIECKGYLLLSPNPVIPYRGIDRDMFLPALTQDLIVGDAPVDDKALASGLVWPMCPPGWRQDAYRLYEENRLCEDGPDLLNDLKVAHEIKRIIEPYLGLYEVVACEILKPSDAVQHQRLDGVFLGYDIAYSGGDYFSAIRAAFFGSPWFYNKPEAKLILEFKMSLNEFGLFPTVEDIPRFIARFRDYAPSEANSEFCIWALTLV